MHEENRFENPRVAGFLVWTESVTRKENLPERGSLSKPSATGVTQVGFLLNDEHLALLCICLFSRDT